MAPVSMSADRSNPFVETGGEYKLYCSAALHILPPSGSPAYLYCTSLLSFPAGLLAQLVCGSALCSLQVGTTLDQVLAISAFLCKMPQLPIIMASQLALVWLLVYVMLYRLVLVGTICRVIRRKSVCSHIFFQLQSQYHCFIRHRIYQGRLLYFDKFF